MERSKTLFWMIVVFVILNILDTITAFFILPGESNPLFLLTGSIWPAVLIKAGVIGVIIYMYYKNVYETEFVYYTYIHIIILGILFVLAGVLSNIHGINNPEVLEEGKNISDEEKVKSYGIIVLILVAIPYGIGALSFKIYEMTRRFGYFDMIKILGKFSHRGRMKRLKDLKEEIKLKERMWGER